MAPATGDSGAATGDDATVGGSAMGARSPLFRWRLCHGGRWRLWWRCHDGIRNPRRSGRLSVRLSDWPAAKELRMRIVFVLIVLMAANTCSLRAAERVVLHPDGGDPADVELFVAEPEGSESRPVILFVHGHQSPPRPGARVFIRLDRRPTLATIDEGRLEAMREREDPYRSFPPVAIRSPHRLPPARSAAQ
jgi:hypothetical protein